MVSAFLILRFRHRVLDSEVSSNCHEISQLSGAPRGLALLGIIERGETKRGIIMAQAMTSALIGLQLQFMKPIGLGIPRARDFPGQMAARLRPYALLSGSGRVCEGGEGGPTVASRRRIGPDLLSRRLRRCRIQATYK